MQHVSKQRIDKHACTTIRLLSETVFSIRSAQVVIIKAIELVKELKARLWRKALIARVRLRKEDFTCAVVIVTLLQLLTEIPCLDVTGEDWQDLACASDL
jgi:hypothetical protein